MGGFEIYINVFIWLLFYFFYWGNIAEYYLEVEYRTLQVYVNQPHLITKAPMPLCCGCSFPTLFSSSSSQTQFYRQFLEFIIGLVLSDPFFLCIPHKSDTIPYLSFFFWLTSLSTNPSNSIHVSANYKS